jgi:predicted NBD/HSP70 family sugar kinase
VDEGIGGALILNGTLYNGSQGFAGEIGLMRAEFNGKIDALDEFVSLRVIKKHLGEKYGKKLHTADVAELYHTSKEEREYINATARCLGKLLKDIVELLDIPVIVLSGRVTLFGEEYIAAIDQEVKRSFNNAEVFASTLGSEASIIGAVSKAVEQLTDARFES